MDRAYVLCGKLGDILSGIALAQQIDQNPLIVTSAKYAPALKGIARTDVFPGDWDDLRGAIAYAKAKYRKVVCPQTHGKDFPIKHDRPSFQLDQAARMGVDFYSARLKVPRKKIANRQKVILLVDHSESSPFKHTDDLLATLIDQFQDYKVARISEFEVGDFKNFATVYDDVSAIVTIDTSHLHFTSATDTPVFALAWDDPVRWRGSAWHPRFSFYCRYGDYEMRKQHLVKTIRDTLDNKERPVVRIVPTVHQNAYNPSIQEFGGRIVRAYRFHPDPTLWPTSIAIDNVQVKMPDALKTASVEDPRLFVFGGKLHLSYVFTPYPIPKGALPTCAVGYGELVNENGWRLVKHNQPKIGNNNLTALEKNFVFFEHSGKLFCIYQCAPDQIVYELHGEIPVKEWKSNSPVCSFGNIRGGTQPISYNGQWLRFFHTLTKAPKKDVWWFYACGALLMQSEPPFAITAVSSVPIIAGDERYFHGWKFWKPRVVIPYGAVAEGDGWRVSVGVNDSACADMIVKPEQLHL